MFVHLSKNLKNHEKEKTRSQEDVPQRNGGHEEISDVYHEVWWQDEKTLLSHEKEKENDSRHEGRCQA